MISEYEYLADDATTYHIPVRDDFALALSMTPEAGGHLPLPPGVTPRNFLARTLINGRWITQAIPVQSQAYAAFWRDLKITVSGALWEFAEYQGESEIINPFPGAQGPAGPQGQQGEQGLQGEQGTPGAGVTAIPNNTVLGNVSGGSALPVAVTGTQLTVLANVFSPSLKGLAPASGGGTTNFLRADNSWAAPPGFPWLEWMSDPIEIVSSSVVVIDKRFGRVQSVDFFLTCREPNEPFEIGDVVWGLYCNNRAGCNILTGNDKVTVCFNAVANCFRALHPKSAGALVNLDNARWRLTVVVVAEAA